MTEKKEDKAKKEMTAALKMRAQQKQYSEVPFIYISKYIVTVGAQQRYKYCARRHATGVFRRPTKSFGRRTARTPFWKRKKVAG